MKPGKGKKRLLLALVLVLGLALALVLAPRALRPREQAPDPTAGHGVFDPAPGLLPQLNPQGSGQLPKEETVYATLGWDGRVEDAWVVNAFQLQQDWRILDYGPYLSLTNLSSLAPLEQDQDRVLAQAGAGSFYYQGRLGPVALPWHISLSYTLDGEPVADGSALAGASGWLEVELSFSRDHRVDPVFYDNYALQVTFTLPADRVSRLEAGEATIAAIGGDKTLSYIVFAGAEQAVSLAWAAQVRDFEMAGVAIAGLPLTLDLEQADFNREELSGDLQLLADGILQLDDGAGELSQGAAELDLGAGEISLGAAGLADGVFRLYQGAADLAQGAEQLSHGLDSSKQGAEDLEDGAWELRQGAAELDQAGLLLYEGSRQFQAEMAAAGSSQEQLLAAGQQAEAAQAQVETLTQAYIQAVAGLQTLLGLDQAGLPVDPAQLEQAGQEADQARISLDQASAQAEAALNDLLAASAGYAISQTAEGYAQLDRSLSLLSEGLSEYSLGAAELYQGMDQLYQGLGQLSEGAGELAGGGYELWQGSLELRDGVDELLGGAARLADGAAGLAAGADQLHQGVEQLKEGSGRMRRETRDLDGQLQDRLDELLQRYGGADFTPVSFASPKNQQVTAVQFVFTTEAVSPASPETQPPAGEDEQTLWRIMGEKFSALFEKMRGGTK